ncbi:hypothetical protein AB1Y20_012424 [Prymnesium parvum]|uniref:Bifunctional lysine-specific demethylase and histidyl-hydroxylase n=1 Tax=Prymnesium parvum TaxID=97485 RepID=A0AB34IKH2_PRYPA
MWGCPPTQEAALARLLREDPRPRLIPGNAVAGDILADLGATLLADGGVRLANFTIGRRHTRYSLTSAAHSPQLLRRLAERYPLPPTVARIRQRPIVSLGVRGSGEVDIARHYHPLTAMLLLHGEKVWALRPPGDDACARAAGECTHPMDICEYYAQADAPPPACVQRAGEILIVPDGWHHGTCNTAPLTVGFGGQGWSYALQREEEDSEEGEGGGEAEVALFARLAERALGESTHARLRAAAAAARGGAAVRLSPLHSLGAAAQSALQAVRSMFGAFARGGDAEVEADSMAFLHSLVCLLVEPPANASAPLPLRDLSAGLWQTMRSWQHAHLLLPLGSAVSVRMRRRKGTRARSFAVEADSAVLWYGTALDEVELDARATAVYCKARKFSAALQRDRQLRRIWEAG